MRKRGGGSVGLSDAKPVHRLGLALIALFLSCMPWREGYSDQTDQRLNSLFEQLMAAEDMSTAAAVERQVWNIWIETGRGEVDLLVSEGIEAMSRGDIKAAIALFDKVVEMAPQYAEGWNKRATAYYLADEMSASMEDIRRTLVLEPRHFGAIAGMGLIFLHHKDGRGALRAFQEVLKIHPRSPGARSHVKQLRAMLGEKDA